jgi:shikimate 5-dehydrogenase
MCACAGTDGNSEGALQGKTAVVLGTGGAARALLFGAAARGANVIVAGRNLGKAEALAAQVAKATGTAATACTLEDVQAGRLDRIDVLLNTTPLGMVGAAEDRTPVQAEVLQQVSFACILYVYVAEVARPRAGRTSACWRFPAAICLGLYRVTVLCRHQRSEQIGSQSHGQSQSYGQSRCLGQSAEQLRMPLQYKPLVFDAVYTPLETRLLKEAAQCGCKVVTGLEMFVGQAAMQFQMFTDSSPPVDLMRQLVLNSTSP